MHGVAGHSAMIALAPWKQRWFQCCALLLVSDDDAMTTDDDITMLDIHQADSLPSYK